MIDSNVFATAESTIRKPGESDIDWANRTYCPDFPAIHACGSDDDENRNFTIFNLIAANDDVAKLAWEAARRVGEVEAEAGDLLIDLNTSEGHELDFWTNRQLLPLVFEVAQAALNSASMGEVIDAR